METDTDDIRSVVSEVYQYFVNRKTLFIFDNAVNTAEFKSFLPKTFTKTVFTLIISREQEWGTRINVFRLGLFCNEVAWEFVQCVIDAKDPLTDVQELCLELELFPLAIHQSVAYIDYQRKHTIDKRYAIKDCISTFREQN